MTLEDEILIACARLHLDDSHREHIVRACAKRAIDWELVYRSAIAHKIGPLVYGNLKACGTVHDLLPKNVVNDFQEVFRWYAFKNAVVTKRVAEMVAFFETRSHDVLLLKHVAFFVRLRSLYDVTMADDVDAVVRPKREPADELDERYLVTQFRPWTVANRFRRVLRHSIRDTRDPTNAVINEFCASHDTWRGLIGLELENRFHHDVVWGGVIPIDFRTVWEDAIQDQVEGRPVFVPDVHDLIVMSAVAIHRRPYLRLRNIVELHELVRSRRDFDWAPLPRKARAYHCSRLVYSALHATKAVLGSEVPESVLKALAPGAVHRRAITFINRRLLPSAVGRSRSRIGRSADPRRGFRDLARRFLALDAGQLARFIWFRIILHRILGVIKW